jgi:hypothetical protein
MWMELAVLYGIFAVGGIFFGHFEAHTPPWRRLLKVIALTVVTLTLYYTIGRPWSLAWLALPLLFAAYVHGIVLPRHGINGLTGEPHERYEAFRARKKLSGSSKAIDGAGAS